MNDSGGTRPARGQVLEFAVPADVAAPGETATTKSSVPVAKSIGAIYADVVDSDPERVLVGSK